MAAKKSTKRTTPPVRTAKAMKAVAALPSDYPQLLEALKARVRQAQLKAALAANREMIRLYWDVGALIVDRQQNEGWGRAVIERLARDVQLAFPGLQGFSPRNIWRMRAFYLAYTQGVTILAQPVPELARTNLPQPVADLKGASLPQVVAEIPWGHNILLLEKLKDSHERLWYAKQTIQNGWSRAVLTVQIESDLFRRQGKAVTNFAVTLPPPQSDLAAQTLKDPYVFDFLTLGPQAQERELEHGLLAHIQRFLLELGVGFAFVGRQVPLAVGDDDFYIDLLFYHLRLRCFVVIDLKMDVFKPEFAGKMNFYLSAVDDRLRQADDRPSIGLILCKSQDRVVAEYALRDLAKPIGVAEWQTRLVQTLPEELKGSLPTIEEIEAELAGENVSHGK